MAGLWCLKASGQRITARDPDPPTAAIQIRITADVEVLLAERGVIVSRETVRLWVNRFGAHFAACIRRNPNAS